MKRIIIALFLLVLFAPVTFAKETEINKTDYLNLGWWEKFNDDKLTGYILSAYENNPDLKAAAINTKQAEQMVKMSFSRELPEITFDGRYQREFESSEQRFGDMVIPNYSQSNFVLPLTMTYEFDIWGKNRLKTKSLKLQNDITVQDEKSAYISLTSAIAANYFNLIKADNLIENQKRLIELQKQIVSMEEKKYNAGLCPITELLVEKQALTAFESELNLMIENMDVIQNRMSVLIGDRELREIAHNDDFQIMPVPEYLDTKIIENRPDFIKTEYLIQKAGYDVRIAKKDFLPSFLVYGQIGFNAYQLGKIFTPDTWLSNIGVMPTLDIFTGGLKLSRLKFKKLEYEKTMQYFEKTVLTSIQELNDSLVSAKISNKNYTKALENYSLEENLYTLSKKKLDIGAKSNLAHLKAEQALLIAKKNEISNKADCNLAAINIYKASGGTDYINLQNLPKDENI